MTPTRRILFGLVASILLVLGLVKAAESFDPVIFGGRQSLGGDGFGDPAGPRLS